MYDYCIYRRDVQLNKCEALVDDWEEEMTAQDIGCRVEKYDTCIVADAKVDIGGIQENKFFKVMRKLAKRPGWGQVYNYDNMHNELNSNTGGDFESATCDTYYAYLGELEY